jgi:hypothetical protein
MDKSWMVELPGAEAGGVEWAYSGAAENPDVPSMLLAGFAVDFAAAIPF